MWRLVFGEDTNITFTEAAQMDWDTLLEANAAYDLYMTAKRKSMKGKK